MFEFEKKEQTAKKNDDWLDTIGYMAIGVAGIVILGGLLPVFIVGLVAALIMSKVLEKRILYSISLISSFVSGLLFYLWGVKPIIQSVSFWKLIIPKWINTLEEMYNQNQPYVMTVQSYVQILFLGIAVSGLLVFMGNRWKINFFTHEKEEDKEKLYQSEAFRRFFKKRVAILNKKQDSYRKSDNKDVYVGMNERKKSIFFPLTSLFTHALIQGTTGAGKTTLMYAIMEAALRMGFGSIFIDGKGDGTTEEEIRKLADHYGKKVYVFSEDTDYRYNPVKYGSATAIKDRLMDVMSWSDKFYENEAQNQLQQIVLFIHEYIEIEKKRGHRNVQGEPLKNDLQTIHRFLNLSEIANYLFIEQSEYVITKDYTPSDKNSYEVEEKQTVMHDKDSSELVYKKYLRMFFDKDELTQEDLETIKEERTETSKYIRGLRTQLELLIYSDLGQKFVDDPEKTLDIKKILLNGDIVLFSFDTNSYSRFMESMGRFIVSDISAIVTQLYKDRKNTDFAGAIGFFDEFGSYVNEKILDVLRKARSANLGAVIGVQSISDFETDKGDLTKKARNNLNMYFLGRSNDPDNAEDSSNTAGTYRDIDKTVMTENIGSSLFRVDTKADRGTVRKVHKYWFSPDEVKDMPNYTFLYIDKTTGELEPPKEKVFVRNTLHGL